jgi:hypothetical protein
MENNLYEYNSRFTKKNYWNLQVTYETFFLTLLLICSWKYKESRRPFYQNLKLNNETSLIKWKTKRTHHKPRWQKTYDWKRSYKKYARKDNCYILFHLHKVHTIILKEVNIQKEHIICEEKNDQLCKNSWLIKRCEMKHSINKKMDNIRHHTISIVW